MIANIIKRINRGATKFPGVYNLGWVINQVSGPTNRKGFVDFPLFDFRK